jgi:hypothetical protein
VELRQLEAFVAVATELHFGRAAEPLHMAPPTLSELIRRLERELGTPLFTRTTRRVAKVFCAEPLLVGLRPDHRLAGRDSVALTDTDLAATRWAGQPGVDWILLIPSLAAAHTTTVIRPVDPAQLVPFTLQWNPSRANTAALARFVHVALTAELPPAGKPCGASRTGNPSGQHHGRPSARRCRWPGNRPGTGGHRGSAAGSPPRRHARRCRNPAWVTVCHRRPVAGRIAAGSLARRPRFSAPSVRTICNTPSASATWTSY